MFGCKTIIADKTPAENPLTPPDGVYRLDPGRWTGTDDTLYLQEMLDSEYEYLLIPASPGAWVTDPLFINRDNLTLYFEEGSRIEAKPGSFKGRNDCLLTVENQSNISFIGLDGGGSLAMHREDYGRNPYSKAEWRHALSLKSVRNLTVESMIIEESGGDGIYISVSNEENALPYSENLNIRGCLIQNHYRQGISVISAVNLTIDHCEILNTRGTAPEAGIDFEPNQPGQVFQNCLIRDTRLQGNRGPGILIWLKKLNGQESRPVEITVENCDVRRNPLGINIGGLSGKPEGTVRIISTSRAWFNHLAKRSSLDVLMEE